MPVLNSGSERCALSVGTYTIGGNGPEALPMPSLEWCSAVAAIVVLPDGEATIQRLAASVVVRLDQTPLGIAPKPLHDGAEIEFEKFRLTFTTDDSGEAMVTSTASDAATGEWSVRPEPGTPTLLSMPPQTRDEHEPQAATARIVNVRTGDAVTLGRHRIAVGRDDSCDLVVSGMGVSRRHFSVAPVRGGYVLRDESANGTLVNGKPVHGTYLLAHGDVLELDKEELRFEMDGVATPVRSAEAAPTQILDLSRLRNEHGSKHARESSAAGPIQASLEIVRGHYAGASFSIERAVCSLGRGAHCDVRIPDDCVSINHATLLRKGATWFVVDLRSANGTFVDGSRVAAERELPSGSRLRLGSVELRFRSVASGVEAPPRSRKASWLAALLRPFRRPPVRGEGDS